MSALERRRSTRVPLFREEAAVIHALSRDIPVRIVDLSVSGALFSMDAFAPDTATITADQSLQLSLQADRSVFQVGARVVRTTQEFVAVEFAADAESVKKIEAKLRTGQPTT
jgi:hypothetical protein